MGLGKDAGPEAQRVAAAILEVLAGVRTPGQAAKALGISQARYFQLETRAMQALVASVLFAEMLTPEMRKPGALFPPGSFLVACVAGPLALPEVLRDSTLVTIGR